ncbi:MAG: beta-ketoacyl synthase N-terminal-like domain-containing protein [Tepidisphaerales bacterium]
MTMDDDVVITGIGLVTPLGQSADAVLARILAGESAASPVELGGEFAQACPVWAKISGFDPEPLVPEPKTVRLMSRDALLATAAARLAIRDAGLRIGAMKVEPVPSPASSGGVFIPGRRGRRPHLASELGNVCPGALAVGPTTDKNVCPTEAGRADYRAEEVGLFGATGLAGVPLGEVARLVESAADESGRLDLRKLGETGLKQVRPVLSFKILSNMPLCFVSIFEGIQGPNAIYNPWEGQGAQAIAAGIDAIRDGDAACVLAGGCDVKTHELGLIALKQWGVLDSWREYGHGSIPAEGAVFLVLESQRRAAERGARVYARIAEVRMASVNGSREEAYRQLVGGEGGAVSPKPPIAARDGGCMTESAGPLRMALEGQECPSLSHSMTDTNVCPTDIWQGHRRKCHGPCDGPIGERSARCDVLVAGGDGDVPLREAEDRVLAEGPTFERIIRPKEHAGNLFAAAAAMQVAMAAVLAKDGSRVVAHCFGHGSEQAVFVLEGPA